jgi:hypothetical protein
MIPIPPYAREKLRFCVFHLAMLWLKCMDNGEILLMIDNLTKDIR